MGTSAFDAMWGDDTKPKAPNGPKGPAKPSTLDQLWGDDEQPQKPGNFLTRGLSSAGQGLLHAVSHPVQTAESMVVSPVVSAANIAAPSVAGAERYNADNLAQARNVARFGSPLHAQGVTGAERAAGVAQTLANVVAPGVFRGAKTLAAPAGRFVANAAGLGASGALTGAAYSPDDPFAGAVAGGVSAPIVGGTLAGAIRGGGNVSDFIANARRVRSAKPVDVQSFARADEMHAADTENYGQAAEEARRVGGTTPAIAQALEHRRVKPFADLFRDSEGGQHADDATVLREADKLMTRQWKGLRSKMARDGYDAKIALEIKNLKAGQEVLRAATQQASEKPAVTMDIAPEVFEAEPSVVKGHGPAQGPVRAGSLSETTSPPSDPTLRQALRDFPNSSLPPKMQGPGGPAFQLKAQPDRVVPGVRIETPAMRVQTAAPERVPAAMPSYPDAVAEHARQERIKTAANTAADAAPRIMSNRTVSARDIPAKSPEAFRRYIETLDPEQAKAAVDMVLARGKEGIKLKAPTRVDSFFGTLANNTIGPAVRLNRLSPFIEALDRRAGNARPPKMNLEQLMQYLGVAAPSFTFR